MGGPWTWEVDWERGWGASSGLQLGPPKARATGRLAYIRLFITAPSSSSLQALIMNQQWFPSGRREGGMGGRASVQMALLASVGFIWSLCKSCSASQIAFEADVETLVLCL